MRKATLGRRKLTGPPIEKIIGYTVMSRFIDKDENGNRQASRLIGYVEVKVPKYRTQSGLTVKKNAEAKRNAAIDAVMLAKKEADKIVSRQKVSCIIIPKIQKTSLIIKNQ